MTEKQELKLKKKQARYEYKARKNKLSSDYKNGKEKMFLGTFTKRLVALIIGAAIIDLQITYLLAFMDKLQNAENLSIQLVTTILGVAIVYMIRAYFDTKAEHNEANGVPNESVLSKILDKSIKNKEEGILNDAGISVDIDSVLDEISSDYKPE